MPHHRSMRSRQLSRRHAVLSPLTSCAHKDFGLAALRRCMGVLPHTVMLHVLQRVAGQSMATTVKLK